MDSLKLSEFQELSVQFVDKKLSYQKLLSHLYTSYSLHVASYYLNLDTYVQDLARSKKWLMVFHTKLRSMIFTVSHLYAFYYNLTILFLVGDFKNSFQNKLKTADGNVIYVREIVHRANRLASVFWKINQQHNLVLMYPWEKDIEVATVPVWALQVSESHINL